MPNIFSQKDKEDIRNQLLTEGKQMMLECGITKMNLEKLAHSAGIAKGTFYNFFQTKQHFILAIIRQYQEQRFQVLQQEAKEKSGTLTVDEVVKMCLSIYAPKDNPMFHMSDKDLNWIAEKIPPEELFDVDMDLKSCTMLLSCVKGVREDMDCRVVSNFSRMVMFTLMQREYVHQEVLEQNIKMIVDMLTEYITGKHEGVTSYEI